jgi:hypothetical protein
LKRVLDHEFADGHVTKVSEASATSVGRSSLHNTSPGLDICAVLVVVGSNPPHGDVFKDFELVFELADAAEGYASRSVERAIFDKDIGAVCKDRKSAGVFIVR